MIFPEGWVANRNRDPSEDNDDIHYFTEDARIREECRIKVGVRVRPFNYREKEETCKLVVDMKQDGVVNLDMSSVGKGKKEFEFDYTFCSLEGSNEKATQECVYNQLSFLVDESRKGYNCSIFTYGQTGTGKSYSLMGPVENEGILYRSLKYFFKKQHSEASSIKTELEVSFLEIYNESVRDLLTFNNLKRLRVRVDKTEGVFVQGLAIKTAATYEQASWLIDTGFKNRTVASTKMNTASSRSHCIFSMYIKTVLMKGVKGRESEIQTRFDLIDLAGSEKQGRIASAGIRLREAGNINHSLAALGRIISALTKGEKFVPYRHSVLTTLVSDNLGGNCKTVMLCTISPSNKDLTETWATLRCGARVRSIINNIKVNEPQNSDEITSRLRENVTVLKKRMQDAKTSVPKCYSGSLYKQDTVDKLLHLEAVVKRREKTHEERCRHVKMEVENINHELLRLGLCGMLRTGKEYSNTPRLRNISIDPIMTGRLIYFLRPFNAEILIGTKERDSPEDNRIVILCSKTAEIQEVHAMIKVTGTVIELTSQDPETCDVFVNGSRVDKTAKIFHNDRLVFGSGQVCFHFISPNHPSPHPGRRLQMIDYEMISTEQQKKNIDVIALQEMLIESREIQIEKTRILQNNYSRIQLQVMQTSSEEKELKRKLTEDKDKLEPKERKHLLTLFRERKRYRQSLDKEKLKNIEMMEQCRLNDGLIESQLTNAFSLCRLSATMARVNAIKTVYFPFTIPFWDGEKGLPNEKVMIMEAFHIDDITIDCMYDYDSFELRHTLQAEYEFRDKLRKSNNPFVPDMPTQSIGVAHITHMPKSMEPTAFIIKPVGKMIGSRGTISACLSIEQDHSEFQITLSVENFDITGFEDTSLMKAIGFINPCGVFEIVQGTRFESGKSFGFPDIKVLTGSTPGLKRYLKTQGVKVFVAVYPFQNVTLMPNWIFHKVMTCQVELQRCKELRWEKEKMITCYKEELHEFKTEMFYADKAHKEAVVNLQSKNQKLVRENHEKMTKKSYNKPSCISCQSNSSQKLKGGDVAHSDNKSGDEILIPKEKIPEVIIPKLHLLASCFEDINYKFIVFDSTLNMMEKGWGVRR